MAQMEAGDITPLPDCELDSGQDPRQRTYFSSIREETPDPQNDDFVAGRFSCCGFG